MNNNGPVLTDIAKNLIFKIPYDKMEMIHTSFPYNYFENNSNKKFYNSSVGRLKK